MKTRVIYRPGSFWNAERDIVLKRLWLADERSATEIATILGASSRNAVIGRAHRIGLPGKAGAARGKRKGASLGIHPRETLTRIKNGRKGKPFVFVTSPNMVRQIQMVPEPMPPPAEFDVPRIATVDLERHHCRFPCVPDVRDVGPYAPIFCGLKPVFGAVYCDVHLKRAHAPVRPMPPAASMPAPVVEKELQAA